MEKRKIISSTTANETFEIMWCVHFMSSYYDDDSRAPGTVPVDKRFFVLATTKIQAEEKVANKLKKLKKNYGKGDKAEIETTVVILENLVAARDSSQDGRLGWHSTAELSPIELTCEEDSKRYRLGVCLIPIE